MDSFVSSWWTTTDIYLSHTHIYEYSREARTHAPSYDTRMYKNEENTTLKRSVTNFKFTSGADSTNLLNSID